MNDSKTAATFLREYGDYVAHVLKPARQEVKKLLGEWREPGFWSRYKGSRQPDPSPVQRVRTRIKRPESVVDKIKRKPSEFPSGLGRESFEGMQDALGARLIVYFLHQLPLIDKELQRPDSPFEISKDAPPVAYLSQDLVSRLSLQDLARADKDSGYASVHYVLRLRKNSPSQDKRPWFELQVRTLVEDTWAEIEHILGYKPQKRTSLAVTRQFQIISGLLRSIDEHFSFLAQEQARFQGEISYQDTDPLNPENLPSVLAEVGLSCAQREIDGMLKVLTSRRHETVGKFRLIATPKRIEIIRNTYLHTVGRSPVDFEVIANLANLDGCRNDDEIIERVKGQIQFLHVWREIAPVEKEKPGADHPSRPQKRGT